MCMPAYGVIMEACGAAWSFNTLETEEIRAERVDMTATQDAATAAATARSSRRQKTRASLTAAASARTPAPRTAASARPEQVAELMVPGLLGEETSTWMNRLWEMIEAKQLAEQLFHDATLCRDTKEEHICAELDVTEESTAGNFAAVVAASERCEEVRLEAESVLARLQREHCGMPRLQHVSEEDLMLAEQLYEQGPEPEICEHKDQQKYRKVPEAPESGLVSNLEVDDITTRIFDQLDDAAIGYLDLQVAGALIKEFHSLAGMQLRHHDFMQQIRKTDVSAPFGRVSRDELANFLLRHQMILSEVLSSADAGYEIGHCLQRVGAMQQASSWCPVVMMDEEQVEQCYNKGNVLAHGSPESGI